DPRYSRRTAWRTTVASGDVAGTFRAPVVRLWLGRQAHLVLYPIRSETAINIVAIVGDDRRRAGWASEEGDKEELLAHFPAGAWVPGAPHPLGGPRPLEPRAVVRSPADPRMESRRGNTAGGRRPSEPAIPRPRRCDGDRGRSCARQLP